MAAEVEEAHEPALTPHHHHHPHIHHHHHPPPPPDLFHHHSHSPHYHHHPHPPPHLFHHHSHSAHHHHPPPPPFLCARCKCWNFPANPNFNPYPYAQAQELPTHAASTDLQAQEIPSDRFDAEDEEDEEEGYELVMTDEWMEFFAKSEARRQEKKRQQKKAARDMRKATRARSQAHDEPSTAE